MAVAGLRDTKKMSYSSSRSDVTFRGVAAPVVFSCDVATYRDRIKLWVPARNYCAGGVALKPVDNNLLNEHGTLLREFQ